MAGATQRRRMTTPGGTGQARRDGWTVESLRVGRAGPLGPRSVPSGIDKQPAQGPVLLTRTGLVGDQQGDRHHHGGPDKAVHHYPREHYIHWRSDLGEHPLLLNAGAFGENFSTSGLTEADVAIGDRFAVGGAIVEVSQGRQPCFRLNLRFGHADTALKMQCSGHTGWYYRVIAAGVVAPGDTLHLIGRLTPSWTIARLHRILYLDPLNRAELRSMAALAHLPERWRVIAEQRLRSSSVEDWTRRLSGS